ncbi:MAG: alpha/beta hydrolase [Prosthecobacter sp.]|nr:alpha/beta hydrolase [Prosthecobacter sp.]
MNTLSAQPPGPGGLFGLVIVLCVAGCAAYAPPRVGEKIHRDVLFAAPGGHELRMDLYVPQTGRPVPVVLWIFGGGWRIGSKGYHVNVRDLTRSGIAVAAIQYRMSGTAVYPAQLDDCRAAVRWLRENGRHYGLDPKRIGASGESSGGHLAALLGMIEGKASIRAVCAIYPPTDLITMGSMHGKPRQKSSVEKLLGGPIEQRLALAVEASPINHISASTPPFLLIHGAHDGIVPLEQSQALLHELEQAKVEARLIVVPEKRHWFRLDKHQAAEVALFFQTQFKMPP